MKNYILIAITIFAYNSILAQKNLTIIEKNLDKNNQIQFAKLNTNTNGIDDKSIVTLLKNVLDIKNTNIEYRLKQTQTKDELGYAHKEYQQYYKGIKVYGATYAVHIKNENVEFINGEFADLKEFNTIPKLQRTDAIKIAFSEALIKHKFISETQIFIQDLVICKDVFSKEENYKLAFEVSILNQNNQVDEIYFIDDGNGKILNKEFKVCHINTTNAIAQTVYSGTQNYTNGFPISSPNFVTDSYTGDFRLRETRQGVNIITLNNLNYIYSDVGNAIEFSDNDNNWTQAEHGNNKYALDAHWGAEKVFDYWKTVHNRNSIDNAGMNIRNYVHTIFPRQNGGTTPNNASWSGSYMSYGDGDGTTFRNFTALDVCAHEFGHGICQYTCNLAYNYNESGSLNEGFSDIWGAVIEAWAMPNNPPKNRWLLGEEIYIPSPAYLRSMSNPNSSPSPQPDTYGGTYWTNGGIEMHIGSGVLNFWFYLVSEGGSGTNDINNTYSVNSIGIVKAAKIAYETEKLLSSGANYAQARTMSIQAAQSLYGVGSCEEMAVTRAWYAVGVGANYVTPTLAITGGSSSICTNGGSAAYTVTGVPNNATVTWTASPANAVTLTPNGNSCTVTRIGNSNNFISLTASISLCNSATKSINVGMPYTQWNVNGCTYLEAVLETGVDEGPCNTQCYTPSSSKWWCTTPVYNATNVTWQKVISIPATYSFWSGSWSGNNNSVSIMFKAPNQYVELKTIISNPCGSIEQYYCFSSTNVLCSGNFRTADCNQFSVSVEEGSGILKINKKKEICEGIQSSQLNLIQIVDKVGNIVSEQKYSNEQTNYEIDLSTVKNDIYFVLLQYDNIIETHQIGIFK